MYMSKKKKLEANLDVDTLDCPFPPPEEAPEPLNTETSPLPPLCLRPVDRGACDRRYCGVQHFDRRVRDGAVVAAAIGPREKPVEREVEEATVRPVA